MSKGARLLLLEDDVDLREALAEALARQGYEVETAASGLEAVDKAATAAFDVMITDIRMSGMDGLEALAHVKERRPDVGSLVITAYGGESDTVRALRLGATDYLRKPFQLNDFLASVERVVGARQRHHRQEQRAQAQHRVLVEVLEAVAQWPPASPHVLKASRMASMLGRKLGFDAQRCVELQMGSLLALLRHAPGFPRLLADPDLPPLTRRILRATGANAAATDASLAARIGLAAVASAEGPEWKAWLESRYPGLFDEALLATIDAIENQLDHDDEVLAVAEPATRDGLAQLGHALEMAGDRAAAARAFELLLEGSEGGAGAVQALLGQARLAWAGGDVEAAVGRVQRAQERARQLGPNHWGEFLLEAGILMRRAGRDDRADDLLGQAVRVLEDIRLLPSAALARLAWRQPQHDEEDDAHALEAVETLSRPEFTGELLDAVPWLFPRLAAWQVRKPAAAVERLLRHMALAVPGEVEALGTDDGMRQLTRTLRPAEAAEQPPLLRLHSLGTFDVLVGEERVPETAWKGSKNKYLLAFLAAGHGDNIPEEVILEHFWPGDAERGRRNLYNGKNIIVRAITPREWKGEARFVLREGGMLRLDKRLPIWHDVDELERLEATAARLHADGQAAAALECWRGMARLYRGRYLDGCYMDWALERRGRIERMVTGALLRLAQDALTRRQAREAIEYAQRLLDIDPWLQEAHLHCMEAHLLDGKPELAVRQFETCRRRLASDLEMEPSIALLECCHKARLGLSPGTIG